MLAPLTRPCEFNEYWLDTVNGSVPDWAQIHDTHYAYIETYSSTGARSFQEYYNLDTDPGENLNLLKDKNTANDPPASLISTLAARLATARTCAGSTCP